MAYNPNDPYGRQALVDQENQAMTRARGYGNQANDAYFNRARNFNAQQGLNTYARGAYDSISQALKQSLRGLAGKSVGAGRLDTGFYDTDQGTVINRSTQQLNDAIAQQALAAQGQQLQNDQGLADFGARNTSDANDLLTARRQELEDAYREEQQRKRSSGLGGFLKDAVSGVANFALPGIGGAIGDYLGSKI